MKLSLALGAGLAALTLAGAAQSQDRFMMRVAGPGASDANSDGWISRAEASAAADTAFGHLDSNDDNRLNSEDQHTFARIPGPDCTVTEAPEGRRVECERIQLDGGGSEARVHVIPRDANCTTEESGEGDNRRVVVRCEGGDGERRVTVTPGANPEVRVIGPNGRDDCRREESNEGGERRLTVICEDEDGEGERRVEVRPGHDRDVIISHGGGGAWVQGVGPVPPMPPIAPLPPVPPVPMLMNYDGEADLNGDGGLSQDEFRSLQLRYFDAGDVNGDGRIQAPPRPPEPPTPPSPPTPEPPRRR